MITLPEILHGAMFDFADVAGNSVLEHLIHLLHILSMGDCCLKEYIKTDCFNKRKTGNRGNTKEIREKAFYYSILM